MSTENGLTDQSDHPALMGSGDKYIQALDALGNKQSLQQCQANNNLVLMAAGDTS